jgi:hypothetical protein
VLLLTRDGDDDAVGSTDVAIDVTRVLDDLS